MVLFPDGVAKADRCLTCQAFEEPVEVGCVFEAQVITDLFYGEVCVNEGSFCFEYDPLVDEGGGGVACAFRSSGTVEGRV